MEIPFSFLILEEILSDSTTEYNDDNKLVIYRLYHFEIWYFKTVSIIIYHEEVLSFVKGVSYTCWSSCVIHALYASSRMLYYIHWFVYVELHFHSCHKNMIVIYDLFMCCSLNLASISLRIFVFMTIKDTSLAFFLVCLWGFECNWLPYDYRE